MLPERDVQSLAGDEDLRRLARGLALTEGFGFFVLAARSPLQARAAFELLRREAVELAGRDVGLAIFDPYADGFDPNTPIPLATLTSRALAPLLDGTSSATGPTLWVIDASRAAPRDRESWILFFQRCNEVRNNLATRLPGPLILAVPQALLADFAQAAPDFWSIRSAVAVLPPLLPPDLTQAVLPLVEERAAPLPVDPARRAFLLEKVAEARKRVEETGDDTAIKALVIWLDRLGGYEEERGSLHEAEAAYAELLALNRELLTRRSNDVEQQRDLSVSLNKVGDIHRARGDLDSALAAYQEGLGIIREVTEKDPGRLEWQRDLSVSLNKIGDSQWTRGDPDSALNTYQESLGIIKALVEQDPDRLEWQRDLSASLERIGDVHWTRGDLTNALATYRESLDIRKKLAQRRPDNPQCQDDVGGALFRLGLIFQAKGDLPAALDFCRQALNLIASLTTAHPDHTEWRQHEQACRDLLRDLEAQAGEHDDSPA